MTVDGSGPNASDLLSLMESGLLDLLKAEITCSLYALHLPQNSARNNTHSLQGFFPCA